MNTSLYFQRLFLLAASLSISAFAAAQTPVVQWGAGTDIVTGAYFGPNINSKSLNLVTPKTNPVGGGYYRGDPDRSVNRGASVNVYAAVWTDSANAGAEANFRVLPENFAVWHPAIYDTLILNTSSGGPVAHSAGGLFLWQKGDGFINGFSAQAVNFADLRINMVLANNAEQFPELKSNHIVVRQGGQFYVSNDIGGGLANLTIFTNLDDAQNAVTGWFLYDPLADASVIGAPASPVLDDITAIGVLNLVDQFPLQFYSFMLAGFSVVEDPIDPLLPEVPVLRISRAAGQVEIRLPSVPGFLYQLRGTSDFNSWTDLGTAQPGTGTDLLFTQPLPLPGTQDIYRVAISPAP
ncbi:MAG: hypothetical protein JJT96_09655 [Opitutales bacterium]|nr:hypothetical protein [Opitutales bacterium]